MIKKAKTGDPKKKAEKKKRARESALNIINKVDELEQKRARTGVELTDDGSRVRGARGQYVPTRMVHQQEAPRRAPEAEQRHGAGGTGSGHKAGRPPGTSSSSGAGSGTLMDLTGMAPGSGASFFNNVLDLTAESPDSSVKA
jgi:hypothetical protein